MRPFLKRKIVWSENLAKTQEKYSCISKEDIFRIEETNVTDHPKKEETQTPGQTKRTEAVESKEVFGLKKSLLAGFGKEMLTKVVGKVYNAATNRKPAPQDPKEKKRFHEEDPRVEVVGVWDADLVSTLHLVPGFLAIGKKHIYFCASEANPTKTHKSLMKKEFKPWNKLLRKWPLNLLVRMWPRRCFMKWSGVELLFKDGRSLMFSLNSCFQGFSDFINKHKALFPHLVRNVPIENVSKSWLEGNLSCLNYLMEVNFAAGRSYHDLSQYPVFPWVSPGQFEATIRDLSKPMGAFGSEIRKKAYNDRFNEADHFSEIPPYHYGSHYSNPGIVLQFLIRLQPFTSGAIELQGGRFDLPDRIFSSYQEGFKGATEEVSDVRELIPDFYSLPEAFLNLNKLDFGFSQHKTRVDCIELPKGENEPMVTPYHFVSSLVKILEREGSEKVHQWIDLVFGFKQEGPEAVKSQNVFYPLTYEACQAIRSKESEADPIATETQLFHFGQTPKNLFSNPHPKKKDSDSKSFFGSSNSGCFFDFFPDKFTLNRKEPPLETSWYFLPGTSIMALKFFSDKRLLALRRNGSVVCFNLFAAQEMKQDKRAPFSNTIVRFAP